MDLLPFFEWLDTSLLADLAKAYGGVFVVVQMFHLLALALLGGMVLVGDLRMLGIVMNDIPSRVVIDNTQKGFNAALVVSALSGSFMSAAVATKLYYSEMFWVKMVALGAGILFVYGVRLPLFRIDREALSPWAVRLTAVASLCIWFTVAASGRWIGFS